MSFKNIRERCTSYIGVLGPYLKCLNEFFDIYFFQTFRIYFLTCSNCQLMIYLFLGSK